MSAPALVVTCEHAGNRVPARYAALFRGARARAALDSHRGYDPGALRVARALAAGLDAPLRYTTLSRLVLDMNRSPDSPRLFSSFVASLDTGERERLIRRSLLAHREAVERCVDLCLERGDAVLHVAVHSFSPRLAGRTRNAEIGLLYDGSRKREREIADRWRRTIVALDPALRVRRNYPYDGADDGLTRHLRRRYPPQRYLGLELEINQALLARDARGTARTVCESTRALLGRSERGRRGGSEG